MTGLGDLERHLLQALCNEGAGKQGREVARRGLAGYRWHEPVHQAIFEIVMSFPSASVHALREQLPARLTRRGFPDFEFESLFEPLGLASGELQQLITKLRGSR